MPKFVFKCEICGRKFEKLASFSGHVTQSKDHPPFKEYFEKYPIPEDKLKKYHQYYKKQKVKKESEQLDHSKTGKSTFTVRSDTPLKHVADRGLSNFHALIGINSREYNKDFLRLLPTIFSRANIHICIMGPDANKVNEFLDHDEIASTYIVESVGYNYSLAINILLMQVSSKFPSATVAICDGWTIFSSVQIMHKELEGVNIDDEFIRVETVFDYEEDPINLKMDPGRLLSSTLNRLRNMKKFEYHIPIILCKIKNIVDLESGMEEDLFSEFSRSHLRNQLITAGLKERIVDNKGLFLRSRRAQNISEHYDLNLIRKIGPRMDNYIFIPSNHGIEWGDSSRASKMVIDKDLVKWTYIKYKPSIIKLYGVDTSTKDDIVKKSTDKAKLTKEITLTDFSKLIDKKRKILLLVNSKIRDLLGATPLIRGLYEKYGAIDILTRDKLDTSNHLIQNYMVRKIYDLQDIKNRFLPLKNYGPNVIRTVGCSITELNSRVKMLEPVNVYDNLVETNYSIADPYIREIPKPYCSFDVGPKSPNMLGIAISADKSYDIDTRVWSHLETIGSRIGNNSSIHVYFIVLSGERKLFKTDKFKIRKNIHIVENLTPFKASGIIRNCNLFITTSDTDLSWLAWGLDKTTIFLDLGSEIPFNDNFINVPLNRDNIIPVEDIVSHVWRNL